ncbi:MAG: hypothetical protein ACRDK3_00170 [Actinomycetota bacterium]
MLVENGYHERLADRAREICSSHKERDRFVSHSPFIGDPVAYGILLARKEAERMEAVCMRGSRVAAARLSGAEDGCCLRSQELTDYSGVLQKTEAAGACRRAQKEVPFEGFVRDTPYYADRTAPSADRAARQIGGAQAS